MAPKNNNDYYTEDFTFMIRIVILNSMGFFFYGFLVPIVARVSMGASATEIGIVISFLTMGRIAASFLVGYLADHVSSKSNLIVIGSFGRAFAYFFVYLAIVRIRLVS